MAHDINTPITSIVYSLEFLQKRVKTDEEKETLERMKSCADKIINIVNSMRNQIRNLGNTQKESFEVEKVLKDVKVMVHNEALKSNCEIVIKIVNRPLIYGEKNKLAQVITNMVVNSLQAYREINKKDSVIITLYEKQNNVIIEIKDFANGIPEKIKESIFKNILTTKGTKGTGIGLYLAYSVVKGEFSGDIELETEQGKGTTIYIKIPKKKE